MGGERTIVQIAEREWKEHNMRLLVDKLPFYKDDCLFAELRWIENEEDWIAYCDFTQGRCVLNSNERECSFLKEQESKCGEWVKDEYDISHCSECGCINNTVYRNYCPDCGAKMEER